MADWQYMSNGPNPFAQAMMNAGTGGIENTRSPRLAFYTDDASAQQAGFPTTHPLSFDNPHTGQHISWVPDTGYKRREEPNAEYTEGTFGNMYTHPNLAKTHPDAMSTKVGDNPGSYYAGTFDPKTDTIDVNPRLDMFQQDKTTMHEMQHKLNRKMGIQYDPNGQAWLDQLFGKGSDQYYLNQLDEAMARSTGDAIDGILREGTGIERLRKEMMDKTGSRKFYKEK